MPFRLIEEHGFQHGVNKEVPAWMLPPGALADASNLIFDVPGIARQRGGTTSIGGSAAVGTTLGFAYSQDASVIEELYALNGKTSTVNNINRATGAATSLGVASSGDTIYGRPAQHFGFACFPGRGAPTTSSADSLRSVCVAGAVGATSFSNSVTASISSGDTVISVSGGSTANVRAGQVVVMAGNAGIGYIGRVVAVLSATTFSVWPPSPYSIASSAGNTVASPFQAFTNAACAASFQSRLCWGNVLDVASAATYQDRRVNYSLLPTESNPAAFGGATFAYPGSLTYYENDYFEVPGTDPIVGMEAVSDNELLILTTGAPVIFRGVLATQTTTFSSGITFDIFPLNTNANCLSDFSIQRTPHGVIWASAEGVMLYAGGGRAPIDLTEGRYHTAWRNLTRGSSFAIHGAAYVRNHYLVSGTSGGSTFILAHNLDSGTWAPLAGNLDIFIGVARPTDRSQVFSLRWWAQAGAAPTFTGGQVVRFDSIFAPDVWGQTKADADGSAVAFSGTSRSITDDAQTERFLRELTVRSQSQMAASSVAVNVGARLDSTDTVGTPTSQVGLLSSTAVATITGATNASPIVITTSANHGLQSEDEVDIHGVGGNTNANGRWRIIVLSTTTFSLNQSRGNAAYTAGGTVKARTEQTFLGTGVDIGQANFVTLASTGTVNRFEWHGLRIGALEIGRGMGRV